MKVRSWYYHTWHTSKLVFIVLQHYLREADGLCNKLETPLPKRGGFEGAVDWKQFEDSGWVLQKKDLTLIDVIGGGEFGGQ